MLVLGHCGCQQEVVDGVGRWSTIASITRAVERGHPGLVGNSSSLDMLEEDALHGTYVAVLGVVAAIIVAVVITIISCNVFVCVSVWYHL